MRPAVDGNELQAGGVGDDAVVPGARIPLCRFGALQSGVPRRIVVGALAVVIVRIGDAVYALEDRCSHQDVRLSEGEVEIDDLTIECCRHGSTFSLSSGEALTLPATRPVAVFDVVVENGGVALISPDGDAPRSGGDLD